MKRSAWRYLWKSEDIRKKLLITLASADYLPSGGKYPCAGH